MSSVSSAGGGVDLAQYLKRITSQNPSGAATTAAGASSTAAGGVQGHHRHGRRHSGESSQFLQQLQSSVTSALQSAGQKGADPNKALTDAIEKILQNNNSATTASSGGGSSQANLESGAANTPASTTTGTGGAAGASNLQAFFQTLQSAGINPKQFHQDFLAAFQGAQQNGAGNPGSAFQSVPLGSIIDTTG